MPCLAMKSKENKTVKATYLHVVLILSTILNGCKDDDIDTDIIITPSTYEFKRLSEPDTSSVDYREATTRLLLIQELESLIESEYLQEVGESSGKAAVINLLNTIYEGGTFSNITSLVTSNIYDPNDTTNPTPIRAIELIPNLSLVQTTYSDVTTNVNIKNLIPRDKSALPLSENGKTNLLGWSHTTEPIHSYIDTKIQAWFSAIAQIASDGDPDTKSSSIINYKELLINFLYGAISYAQVTNTFLKDPINLPSNTAENNADLTEIQHKWDMAFGYFGAPTSIKDTSYSDLQNTDYFDVNQDTQIDIYSEMATHYIRSSSALDNDSVYLSTNFTKDIYGSFLQGRAFIDASQFRNSEEELQDLSSKLLANQLLIIKQWERVTAAQMIRHINAIGRSAPYWEVLESYDTIYIDNWSSLKALALTLQFSPSSSFSYDELHQMHIDISTQPYKLHALNNYLGKVFNLRQDLMQKFEFSEIDVETW